MRLEPRLQEGIWREKERKGRKEIR